MESDYCFLELGTLNQKQTTMLQALKPEASCQFYNQPDLFGKVADLLPSTLQIIGDHVVEVCSSTQSFLSGFQCDYSIQFQVIRSQTNTPKSLGSPEEVIFFFNQENPVRQVKLRLEDELSNFQKFIDILSTKYIVRRGFRESFRPIMRIGKGMTASVYKAESLEKHEEVAIKTFKRSVYFQTPHGKESFQKQFKILSKLKHQNLSELIAVYETQNSTYVVIELLAISLFSFVKQYGFPSIAKVKDIMRSLLEGIKYLHSLGIMHRDLKLQNIMMRSKNGILEPVIVDFGLAEYLTEKEFTYTRCGTPGYVAPEILSIKANEKKIYTESCDIFSLGVIFHILLFKRPVFDGKQIKEVIKKNTDCQINFDFPEFQNMDENAQDLLKMMLKKDPTDRVSAVEALNHPFLKVVYDNNQEKQRRTSQSIPNQQKLIK